MQQLEHQLVRSASTVLIITEVSIMLASGFLGLITHERLPFLLVVQQCQPMFVRIVVVSKTLRFSTLD
jgi:hypothetical protein